MTGVFPRQDFLKRVLFLSLVLWGMVILFTTDFMHLKGFFISLLIVPFVIFTILSPFVALGISTFAGTTFIRFFMTLAGLETAYILFGALGFLALIGGLVVFFRRKEKIKQFSSGDTMFLLLTLVFVFGLLYSEYPDLGLLRFGTFFVGSFIPYFALYPLRGKQDSIEKLIWFGLALMTITSFATGVGILIQGVSNWQRFTFAGAGPIGFSRNFALAVLFSFLLFDFTKNKLKRIFLILFALLNIAILVAVATRGPVISLAGALLIHFSFFSNLKLTKRILILTLIIGFGVFVATHLFHYLIVRMSAIQGTEVSSMGRMMLWKTSLEHLKDIPLWGMGTSSYKIILSAFSKGAGLYYPHNIWLEFYLGWGVFGLGVLLLFLGIVSYKAIKVIRNPHISETAKNLVKISFVLFLYALSNAQVSGDFAGNNQLWVFSGLVLTSASLDKKAR